MVCKRLKPSAGVTPFSHGNLVVPKVSKSQLFTVRSSFIGSRLSLTNEPAAQNTLKLESIAFPFNNIEAVNKTKCQRDSDEIKMCSKIESAKYEIFCRHNPIGVCNQSLEIQKTMVWQPCWMTEPFVLPSNMAALPLSFWISRDWLQTTYSRYLGGC